MTRETLINVNSITNLFKNNNAEFYNIPFAHIEDINLIQNLILTHEINLKFIAERWYIFHCKKCDILLFDVRLDNFSFGIYSKFYHLCMKKLSCQELIVKKLLE